MTSPTGPPTTLLSASQSFPTIVEKVEEEERAAEEAARCPPSPLAQYYSSLTLSDRYAWPAFLGEWAFQDGFQPRRGQSVQISTAQNYSRSIKIDDCGFEHSISDRHVVVSTGCLDEGREQGEMEEGRAIQRRVEESYAKDDIAVGRLTFTHASQPLCHRETFELRHVTVRKRNSVCDIEFRFPFLPSATVYDRSSCDSLGNTDLQRPLDLPLSPSGSCTPSVSQSARTSQGSIPDWEVVARRHSCVHVTSQEWVFFICLLVFVSLCLGISVHKFVLVLLGLQTMYYLLLTLV